jgi:Na+-translocating ferredoxin:NAD+ oxidoreductase RnfG subunit
VLTNVNRFRRTRTSTRAPERNALTSASASARSSDRDANACKLRFGQWPRALALAAGLLLLLIGMRAAALRAQTTLSREEALALAFPGAQVHGERVFLTEQQQREAADLAGSALPSALIARYVATNNGEVVGRAYVDTHTVRTKRESLLVSLTCDGRVRRVDVTAFLEPPEYEAPRPWLDQFRERALTADLAVQRAIRPIAGATLTARAASEAVRRVLAIDRVLSGASAPGRSR